MSHPTKQFARRLLREAKGQGLYAYAVDHEGDEREAIDLRHKEQQVKDITACDLEVVHFRDREGTYMGHVILVLENWQSGDILADHTNNRAMNQLAQAVDGGTE